jgi:hypothetical protein
LKRRIETWETHAIASLRTLTQECNFIDRFIR